MSNEEILNKVQQIIAEDLDMDTEEVQADSNLINDIGLTSMDLLNLIASLEKAFSIRIPEKLMRTFVSVQDVVDCIFAKTEEKA